MAAWVHLQLWEPSAGPMGSGHNQPVHALGEFDEHSPQVLKKVDVGVDGSCAGAHHAPQSPAVTSGHMV